MTVFEKAAELGAMLADTDIMKRLNEATRAYEADEALLSMINAYNGYRDGFLRKKGTDQLTEEQESLYEQQLSDMYDEIMKRPSMVNYMEAKQLSDELMQNIYGEITFQITGQRPCSHNCDGCGGCG